MKLFLFLFISLTTLTSICQTKNFELKIELDSGFDGSVKVGCEFESIQFKEIGNTNGVFILKDTIAKNMYKICNFSVRRDSTYGLFRLLLDTGKQKLKIRNTNKPFINWEFELENMYNQSQQEKYLLWQKIFWASSNEIRSRDTLVKKEKIKKDILKVLLNQILLEKENSFFSAFTLYNHILNYNFLLEDVDSVYYKVWNTNNEIYKSDIHWHLSEINNNFLNYRAGKKMVNFKFYDINLRRVNLAKLPKNKPTLIFIWRVYKNVEYEYMKLITEIENKYEDSINFISICKNCGFLYWKSLIEFKSSKSYHTIFNDDYLNENNFKFFNSIFFSKIIMVDNNSTIIWSLDVFQGYDNISNYISEAIKNVKVN